VVQSRTQAIIDSLSEGDIHAFIHLLSFSAKLLLYRSTLLYFFSHSQLPDLRLLLPSILPLRTRTIRGISYLAQIQSYEYNFPREQSFIVIVNPSVNCPALSITAMRRYNSVLFPSFQPPRPTVTTIRRLRSLAIIY